MTLDAALHTAHSLSSDTPEKTLALVAVGRRRGRPGDEIVRSGRRYGIDHRLQGLLVHVHLLRVFDRDCVKSRTAFEKAEEKNRKGDGRVIYAQHFVFLPRFSTR